MDMQESAGHYPETSRRVATHVKTIATKAEKRIAFTSAIKAGCNKVEAAKAAGVSYTTAIKWAKTLDSHMPFSVAGASLATKQEVAATFSTILRSENADARDRINAAQAQARLMGYEAPQRTENTTLVIHASVRDLVQARTAARLAARAETQPPAAPQDEAASNSFSPPQIISQISTKSST